MYRTADQIGRSLMDRVQGLLLAQKARDDGNYTLAWKHAQTYKLNALDLAELGLPESHRPKGFNPGVPKAMGCV